MLGTWAPQCRPGQGWMDPRQLFRLVRLGCPSSVSEFGSMPLTTSRQSRIGQKKVAPITADDHRKCKNFVTESGNGRIVGKDNIELFDDWDSRTTATEASQMIASSARTDFSSTSVAVVLTNPGERSLRRGHHVRSTCHTLSSRCPNMKGHGIQDFDQLNLCQKYRCTAAGCRLGHSL